MFAAKGIAILLWKKKHATKETNFVQLLYEDE